MKKIIFLIFFGILILCMSFQNLQDKFTITANLTGFAEGSKIIISNRITGQVLDSTTLINNHFSLTGFIDEAPTPIAIVISSDNEESEYIFIFIGNENVQITGNKDNFSENLMITGSKHQEFKAKLDSKTAILDKQRKEKLTEMFSLRAEGKWNDSLQRAYWSRSNEKGIIVQIDNEIHQLTKEFIENNINSDYALSQLIVWKTDFSKIFIKEQLKRLNSDYQKSKYVEVLKTYLENKTLEKGDKFYDFQAENQNGKNVLFSDYFQNKYVLLEFYSSYCSWCIKALPKIKNLANQKSDSLEIITFNVDRNKEEWLKKYKSNGINWTSLYDEKGRYSQVYTKYNVVGTPAYYLFDKNGIVMKKWDGYDENLVEQIEEEIRK